MSPIRNKPQNEPWPETEWKRFQEKWERAFGSRGAWQRIRHVGRQPAKERAALIATYEEQADRILRKAR